MPLTESDRGGLFLAPPTVDVPEPQQSFDRSAEAMRRFRHPFDTEPADPARRPTMPADDDRA